MTVQRRFQHRGQSMLIFALTAMVLFALIGLAVDAGVGYLDSSLLERASSASSLAGVTYMPNGWGSTVNPEVQAIATKNGMKDGNGGVFSAAPCPLNGPICVRTCEVDGSQPPVAFPPCGPSLATLPAANQLAVQICEPVGNSFVRLIGFPATHQECRTSIAEYLRPITLGQPGAQLGGDLSAGGLGSAAYKYFVRTEGYGTDRGQGDAYTPRLDDLAAGSGGGCVSPGHPYAADGANNCRSAFNSTLPDIHFLSGVNGTEYGGALPLTPLPANGGYSYQVFVPAGQTGDLQMFNPIFAPDSSGGGPGSDPCTGAQASSVVGVNHNYNLHECDSLGGHVTGNGSATNQNQYSTMSYTVYQVQNVFDHRTDVALSQMLVAPIDATTWATNSWIEVRGNKIHNGGLPNLFHQWQSVCNYVPVPGLPTAGTETSSLVQQSGSCSLSGGATGAYYRLRLDTLDYLGKDPSSGGGDVVSTAHKGMSVQVAGCAGCTVGGLNEMSIFTPLVAGAVGTQFPISLMAVPPEYRGQTLTVDIYDPGDISCTGGPCSNQLTILDEKQPIPQPATRGVSPTSGLGVAWLGPARGLTEHPISNVDCPLPAPVAVIETQCLGGDVPQNTGSANVYNGTWVRYYVAVSPLYNPGCNYAYDPTNPCAASAFQSNWYWSLQYGLTNATGTDTITFGVGYAGSPVHLVTG